MDSNDKDLSSIRREYNGLPFKDERLPSSPWQLFDQWLKEARLNKIIDFNAMSIATVYKGMPYQRTVLLKGIHDGKLLFFSSYNSRKAKQLAYNPKVSALFSWLPISRQVLFLGVAYKASEKIADEYFAQRPRKSQIATWASCQSSCIKDRKELEDQYLKYEKNFAGCTIPKPEHFGGFFIKVHGIEFWQGMPSRLHDRIFYERLGNKWMRKRLSP